MSAESRARGRTLRDIVRRFVRDADVQDRATDAIREMEGHIAYLEGRIEALEQHAKEDRHAS